jgi:hypothetical protein
MGLLIFRIHYFKHIRELHILFFPHVLIFNKIQNEKYTFKVICNNKHAIIEKTSPRIIVTFTTN